MPLDLTVYGAGLKNGTVRTSDGTPYDIGAIVSAEADVAQDEVEVKGDDELKVTFVSNIREELTIVANALSFDVIQGITGNNYSSSATGVEVAMGTDEQKNPPFVEVSAETDAKDDAGTSVTLKKTWHKVQIKSIKLTQAGESEFNMELTGTAYQTSTDIESNNLGSKRVATVEVYSA